MDPNYKAEDDKADGSVSSAKGIKKSEWLVFHKQNLKGHFHNGVVDPRLNRIKETFDKWQTKNTPGEPFVTAPEQNEWSEDISEFTALKISSTEDIANTPLS